MLSFVSKEGLEALTPVRKAPRHVEVMPPDTNRGLSFAGWEIPLGGRKVASCRDEIVAALTALSARDAQQAFTVSQVHAEMHARGSSRTEPTIRKTMRRMKEDPARPPYSRLERVGSTGFRIAASQHPDGRG